MTRYFCLAAAAAALFGASAVRAESNPFGYSYTANTETPGETEVSIWATDRRGKDEGHYDAQDYRLEIERGITDRFQVAGYVNLASHHVRGDETIDRDLALKGVSLEFKYRVLDEASHGIGFALYAEPGWSRIHSVEGEKGTELELELKAIFSKSWNDGRIVWAGNLTLEPEWEKEVEAMLAEPGERWEKELKAGASTGLAFRVAPGWSLGMEAVYAATYSDWSDGLHRTGHALFAGPTIAFSKGEWSGSLTVLPQVAGGPGPGNLNLDEWEKREIRLKISHEF